VKNKAETLDLLSMGREYCETVWFTLICMPYQITPASQQVSNRNCESLRSTVFSLGEEVLASILKKQTMHFLFLLLWKYNFEQWNRNTSQPHIKLFKKSSSKYFSGLCIYTNHTSFRLRDKSFWIKSSILLPLPVGSFDRGHFNVRSRENEVPKT